MWMYSNNAWDNVYDPHIELEQTLQNGEWAFVMAMGTVLQKVRLQGTDRYPKTVITHVVYPSGRRFNLVRRF